MADGRRARSRSIVAFVVALLLAAVSTPYAASPVWAAFSATTTTASSSMAAKRIFTGTRTVSAYSAQDASSGTAANKADFFAVAGDGRTDQSNGNVASGSNVYFEFTMDSHLPAGLTVSGAQFNFTLNSQGGAGSGNGCFWFDVRSGGSVIGTHGSYSSPIGCSNKTNFATFNTSISEVSTSDIANGLVIRAYAYETGGKKVNVDLATVTGSTPYSGFTLYEDTATDTSSGSVTTPWMLSSVDGVTFNSGSNWPTNYATTKYVSFTFSGDLPTGASLNSVTLNHTYRPSGAVTLCYYFEVYNGLTLLATHGGTSSNVSCNSSSTTFVTDNVALTEVNTAALANALTVKMYFKASAGKLSQQDLLTLSINWSLT